MLIYAKFFIKKHTNTVKIMKKIFNKKFNLFRERIEVNLKNLFLVDELMKLIA